MASARERNSRWTGLYRDQQGKQKSAGTFKTRAAAIKAAKAHEAVEQSGGDAKLALGKPQKAYSETRHGKVTVAGYSSAWLSQHRLEATSRESYGYMLKHINRGLGNIVLAELDAPKVRAFIRNLEASDMSGATVGHVMTVLREMCRSAIADRILDSDPTANIRIADRRAREMRILSKDEYNRILEVIDPSFRLLVVTLVSTGLRWGECIALKSEDVTEDNGRYVIKVRRTIAEVAGTQYERPYGKTAKAMRNVTISSELASQLSSQSRTGYIFTAHRGGKLQRSNFRRTWTKALKDAGVSGVRVHDLRHTHASWLVNNGADLLTVRDRLGHTDLKTTSRYLHTMPGETDRALDALSRAMAA